MRCDCERFELDSSAIKPYSIDYRSIKLPYSGPLPANLEGADNPYIFMRVTPCDVRITLVVNKDGKRRNIGIQATPEEINDILSHLFFKDVKNNTYHTQFKNGLAPYWLGNYQAEYLLWKEIILDGRAGDVILNLPADKRVSLMRFLQLMDHNQANGEPA